MFILSAVGAGAKFLDSPLVSYTEVLGRARQPLMCPTAPVLPMVFGTRRVHNLSVG